MCSAASYCHFINLLHGPSQSCYVFKQMQTLDSLLNVCTQLLNIETYRELPLVGIHVGLKDSARYSCVGCKQISTENSDLEQSARSLLALCFRVQPALSNRERSAAWQGERPDSTFIVCVI